MPRFIAFDIGASSGRVIVGNLKNNFLNLDEIYRFNNKAIQIDDYLHWNILKIYSDILEGLKKYVKKYGNIVDGIGIDTWGVDFILLDKKDELIGYAHHYRDSRTKGLLQEMFKKVPKKEIFYETGVQFMEINSSTQLYSMLFNYSPQLSITDTFLMIPDYLNFLLSGNKVSEYSIATTSQLFNPNKNNWAFPLIRRLGFKEGWFKRIVPSGTILGLIKPYIAQEIGLNSNTKIIAPACHDTGSAVAAVPVDMEKYSRGEWAYLSSGTWSLLGVELDIPLINKKVLEYNFTNEGGINNSIRFLKNVTGMWLIQECRKIWAKNEKSITWDDIVSEAEEAPEFQYFVNPDDSIFLNPKNMIEAIQKYCIDHDQDPPEAMGEISRTIFESLAFRYRFVVEKIEEILNKKIKILHIIGGGSSNRLLNQFTANTLGIPVKAGPKEATAIGNILIQALALGKVRDINELRNTVKISFEIESFYPINTEEWEKGYHKYKRYTELSV